HGTADRILPYEATAQRLPDLVANLRLVAVEGGPHNIGWTHPEECNKALLEFLAEDTSRDRARDMASATTPKR
ncbi:MAG: non-heme chloroperoxidase, partial [Frankiaceae bacterium]|nr:non-heme chloroperoxidase [Frankiaceae bacterium]